MTYAEAIRVQTLDDAYRRRDRGVEGFMKLKAAFAVDAEGGQATLHHFYDLAIARSAPFRPEWARVLALEADAAREASGRNGALNAGEVTLLLGAQHGLVAAKPPARLGFCGHLQRYAPEGILSP